MLSRIDEIIYPNRCEVIEFQDPQRFVYPIFKNGSSSLYEQAKISQLKIHLNNQIEKINTIHVIIRNPLDRFISGVNEFVFYTLRSNPELDLDTIMYFVENYLFLDRHYSPQLGWLVNLNKFLNPNCKIIFHNMEDIKLFTDIKKQSKEKQMFGLEKIMQLKNNKHIQPYINLDMLLFDLLNQELTFNEIIHYISLKDKISFQKYYVLS